MAGGIHPAGRDPNGRRDFATPGDWGERGDV